jgi:hypothetical protein
MVALSLVGSSLFCSSLGLGLLHFLFLRKLRSSIGLVTAVHLAAAERSQVSVVLTGEHVAA